jgi:hypothetical protein
VWTAESPARLLGGRRRAPARHAADLGVRQYAILLALTVVLAAVVQYGLYLHGLYTVSDDESERTLLASHLTLTKAVTPFIWPPLPMIVTGLALRIHHNLITAPRALVGITGLLTLGATVTLARKLFDRRTVALVTAVLAAVIPQRLILSVVPLADIYSYLFVLLAAAFLIDWLRSNRPRALVYTSVALLLASTARFETWFFNLTLAAYVLYRFLLRHDLGVRLTATAVGLLGVFPVTWVVATYVHDGSLKALSLTSRQFAARHGHDVSIAVRTDVVYLFVHDSVFMPILLAGAVALLVLARRDRALMTWAALVFGPMLLLGASMLATFSVPMAAPFRVDGTWIILLIPFAAWALVGLAELIVGMSPSVVRFVGVAALVLVAIGPIAVRVKDVEASGIAQAGALGDKPLEKRLHGLLHSTNRQILLDSLDGLDYLNVLVASNTPGRFVLDVDADPTRVSIYSSARQYYVDHHDTNIVQTYLTDKFGLRSALNRRSLATANIGYILVDDARVAGILEKQPGVSRPQRLGRWTLFQVSA